MVSKRRAALVGLRWLIRYLPFARKMEPLFRKMVRRNALHGEFRFKSKDGTLFKGEVLDAVVGRLWLEGEWEPALYKWMKSRLVPGDTVVDIGANIGAHCLRLARVVGDQGHVVAIEADPVNFASLQCNVRLNRLSNVRCVHVAATAEKGALELYQGPRDNKGMATTIPPLDWDPLGPPVQVPAAPLCEILAGEEIRNLRLLKIDIEGGEVAVIPTLGRLLPLLDEAAEFVIEIETRRYTAEQRHALVKPLLAGGFHMYHIESYHRHHEPYPVTPDWLSAIDGRDIDVIFSKAPSLK